MRWAAAAGGAAGTVGLQGEHVPASGVARSSPRLPGAPQQSRQSEPRRRHLEQDLDPGHVSEERERRQVPQSDRREPHVEVRGTGGPVVRRQVSNLSHTWLCW